jgi:uncharacterized membrane protein YgcG
MKTIEELLLGAENQAAASQAVATAVEDAKQRRREMVEQVNANQRLEGYVPDEQLAQLQERFIAGELTTTEMTRSITDYAQKILEGMELKRALTPEQRKLFEAIDGAISDAAFEGATIDPMKVAIWKKHVLDGMGADELLQLIGDDKEKVIAVRPKPEYHDSPGMKHMGNGYFIGG